MTGIFRIVAKDLLEFCLGIRGVILILVMPTILLLIMGQLRTNADTFRVLMAGQPSRHEQEEYDELTRLLEEISAVELVVEKSPLLDPSGAFRERGFDLLINVRDAGSDRWIVFLAETEPYRLATLRQVAAGIERAIRLIGSRDTYQDLDPELEVEYLAEELAAFGVGAFYSHLYPAALQQRHEVFPKTIAIVICFLPFVLIAPSLVRDKRSKTLEIALAAPSISGGSLFVGRCLSAVVLTICNLLLMLLLTQWFYGLYVRSGLQWLLLAVLPGLLSAAFLGMIASSLARSQGQVVLFSAVYFLWLGFFGDVLYPVSQGSIVVQILSTFLPLTFVHALFHPWMFGAGLGPHLSRALFWLPAQAGLYGVLAWWVFKKQLKEV